MQSPTVSWIMIRVNIQVNAGSNVVSGGGGVNRDGCQLSLLCLYLVFSLTRVRFFLINVVVWDRNSRFSLKPYIILFVSSKEYLSLYDFAELPLLSSLLASLVCV